MRKAMVEPKHPQLSVRRQCELLDVNRNRLAPVPPNGLQTKDLDLARKIDEVNLRFPEFGARRMSEYVNREGFRTTRRSVGRVMRLMGLEAIYRKPRTSDPAPGHKIYPYLLRDREVGRADEVWCTDITYIPMKRGFAYLCAVMDWKTRAVISWKVSTTLDSGFCVEALRDAERRAGCVPEIFNTDQGSQFTGGAWIKALQSRDIRISMDGKGRWIDNVFVERLWRAVKHEGVYLWAVENVHELERHLGGWFEDYNRRKPHSSLGNQTPWECYRPKDATPWSGHGDRQFFKATTGAISVEGA